MSLLANMRMYSTTPGVADLWCALAARVAELSGVPLAMFDHRPPAPMSELWQRRDLGLVQMCGWPFWNTEPRPQIVAAIIPADPLAEGRPVYWTDMIVAADHRASSLEETFGGTIAWTDAMSHSGLNAPRRLILETVGNGEQMPYRKAVGPVVTPAGAIEAVCSGQADVAGLDGYYHLLLQTHDPLRAARIRTIARTSTAPIPPLVAAHDVPQAAVSALSGAILALHNYPSMRKILEALRIESFARIEPEAYRLTQDWAREACQSGLSVAPGYGEPPVPSEVTA